MKKVVFAVLLGMSLPALAATAVWTGKQEMVQTVTGKMVWRCEYQYAGQYFYYLFETSCPSQVEIQ